MDGHKRISHLLQSLNLLGVLGGSSYGPTMADKPSSSIRFGQRQA
jgi:hypothetical protein